MADLNGMAPSAFGLQVIYWIAENGGHASASDLQNTVMKGWKGLGKNSDGERMGSMRSRLAIIERLVNGGYLVKVGTDDMVALSDGGRKFLASLHKDCRDPDLPFRIRKWSSMHEPDARRKIDGYVKAFFGRQARMTRMPLAGGC